jgi:RNA polymerase sigma-70 factor, ECF subfamily
MTKRRLPPAAAVARPDLSAEADDDLLAYMTWKETDPDIAREAWAEFYRRHIQYLFGVCYKAFISTLKSRDRVADLVSEVFKRAYEHAASHKPSGLKDRNAMRRRVRAWLGTIAERLFLDGRPPEDAQPLECQLEQDHWQTIPQFVAATKSDSELIAVVKTAIQTVLTDREREVLGVTLHWYDPSSDHQRLPNEVVAELAQRLGTTPENLRKIRERALAKIEQEVIRVLGRSPFKK